MTSTLSGTSRAYVVPVAQVGPAMRRAGVPDAILKGVLADLRHGRAAALRDSDGHVLELCRAGAGLIRATFRHSPGCRRD